MSTIVNSGSKRRSSLCRYFYVYEAAATRNRMV